MDISSFNNLKINRQNCICTNALFSGLKRLFNGHVLLCFIFKEDIICGIRLDCTPQLNTDILDQTNSLCTRHQRGTIHADDTSHRVIVTVKITLHTGNCNKKTEKWT